MRSFATDAKVRRRNRMAVFQRGWAALPNAFQEWAANKGTVIPPRQAGGWRQQPGEYPARYAVAVSALRLQPLPR